MIGLVFVRFRGVSKSFESSLKQRRALLGIRGNSMVFLVFLRNMMSSSEIRFYHALQLLCLTRLYSMPGNPLFYPIRPKQVHSHHFPKS